jgi:hypothetical protein
MVIALGTLLLVAPASTDVLLLRRYEAQNTRAINI